jgi:hypothetical protein
MLKWNRRNSADPASGHLFLFSFLIICLLNVNQHVLGQRSWTFQLSMGGAFCINTPLIIDQKGYEKIKINAHYRTESFNMPVYYSWKIGTAGDRKGWELELIHLKVILDNNPPEIQHFEISHGFNYLTINRIWDMDLMILRIGAGVILSNPESIIRNMRFENQKGIMNRGYYFSGPGVQFSAEKRIPVKGGLFFDLEIKAAGALTRVSVAEGHAIVPQAGFHGLFGIGYGFD